MSFVMNWRNMGWPIISPSSSCRRNTRFVSQAPCSSASLPTDCGPGDGSGPCRMGPTYWDRAASFVTQGAIPAEMFNAANTEHFALYAKLRPYLTEVRAATRYPDYLSHVEQLVTAPADAVDRIDLFDRYMQRQRALALEGKQRKNFN